MSLTPTTIGQTTTNNSQETYFQNHSIVLPDGSLITTYTAGTSTTFGAGGTQCILVQSSNWQTGTPTWTLVKQFTTNTYRASLWWDASTTTLHVVYAGSASSGTALTYLSATYSGGTWTWGSGAAIVAGGASWPVVCVDGTGTIFVVYRNYVSGTTTTSVQLITNVSGSWGSPAQISSSNSAANANYFGSLVRMGTTTVCVTYENGTHYGSLHPDSGSWTSPVSGPGGTVPGIGLGPFALGVQSSTLGWLSWSGAATGLSVEQFSISGGTWTWQTGTQQVLDSTLTIGAGNWTLINDQLYLLVHKQLSSNNQDLYLSIYASSTSTWVTIQSDLTNAASSNNVSLSVPATGLFGEAVVPVIYQTGTASPYTMELLQVPVTPRDIAGRLRLQATKLSDLSQRLRLLSVSTGREISTRLLLRQIKRSFLSARLLLSAGGTPQLDLSARLLLRQIKRSFLSTRLTLVSGGTSQGDLSARLLLRQLKRSFLSTRLCLSGPLTIQNLSTRLVLLSAATAASLQVDPRLSNVVITPGNVRVLSPGGGGGSFRYRVNGTLLASQPYLATTPTLVGTVIPAGSLFVLLFVSPDSDTQTALATGSVVSLTFLTERGLLTGPVSLVSTLIGGTQFQVTCTTQTTLQLSEWVVKTQFL